MKFKILAIAIVVGMALLYYGCENRWSKHTGGDKVDPQDQSYRVVEYKNGSPVNDVQVVLGDKSFVEIENYLNSSDTKNGKITFTSYAPSLLIISETVKVNFIVEKVVVSTRSDSGKNWHSVVRDKTEEEILLEKILQNTFLSKKIDDKINSSP